jgi:hypothetical protein
MDTSALIAGALAGGIEAVCVWPTENVKTQLQLQGKVANPKFTSFSGGVAHVMKTQGVGGLYTGLVPILIGAFPKVRCACLHSLPVYLLKHLSWQQKVTSLTIPLFVG